MMMMTTIMANTFLPENFQVKRELATPYLKILYLCKLIFCIKILKNRMK